MKKIIISLIFCIATLTACATAPTEHANTSEINFPASSVNEETEERDVDSEKLTIVATLFPQYDFSRQIVGDKVNVVMLMPLGIDTHSYEPSPNDVVRIDSSSMFVYTGEELEPWAKRILSGLDNKSLKIVDVSQNIALGKEDNDDHDHDHDHDHDQDQDIHGHIEPLYDPHIWTDPINAKIIVDTITEAISELDPENAQYYRENAENYKILLDELDADFRRVVEEGNRTEMVFGGRFAFYYFVNRYGLDYISAYDSCFGESEPSTRAVLDLINKVKEEDVRVIYYEELSTPRVSQMISDETGAKMLVFRACHNVSREELQQGVTYYSLMKQNVEHLKEGLQ